MNTIRTLARRFRCFCNCAGCTFGTRHCHGAQFDREMTGHDYTTAINPHDPKSVKKD